MHIISAEIKEKATIGTTHSIRHVFLSNQCNKCTKQDRGKRDPSFYLIQFHSLRLEAEHVDGKVVVLLLQQHHPKKHKIPPMSKCFWLDPQRPCFQQVTLLKEITRLNLKCVQCVKFGQIYDFHTGKKMNILPL